VRAVILAITRRRQLRPLGLAGWVHVSSFTEPAEALLEYREWALRPEGGERRESAALLAGAWVEVERAELPPTGDREYYRADLIGFEVENLDGVRLGRVAYFMDAPAGAVMVVEDREGATAGPRVPGRREHWVLADPEHLRHVDLAAGRILVDWPAELE